MPAFDGDSISVGDRLFDTGEDSAVTVMQLYSNRIMVAIPGKGSRSYTYGGVMSGNTRKTLFWHDPQILIPRKDPQAWSLQKSTLRSMMESLSIFITGAHFHDAEAAEDAHAVLEGTSPHVDQSVLDSAAIPAEG